MIEKSKKVYLLLGVIALIVNACTYGQIGVGNGYTQADAIKGQGGSYKVGAPYKIMGQWYYPKEDYNYSEVGTASWYGKDFHAKKTANGERYDMHALTAAHRTLPLPSIVKVTNLENGRSLVLRVNDRGPYAKNRIIDISKRGAQLLGYQTKGTAKVRVEVLERESKALKAALTGEKTADNVKANYNVVKNANEISPDKRKPLELIGAGAGDVKSVSAHPQAIKAYPRGSWFVQLGAYSSEKAAQDLGRKLDGAGESNIYYVTVNGKKYYRVRIGPFAYRKEAEVSLVKVKNMGVYNAQIMQD